MLVLARKQFGVIYQTTAQTGCRLLLWVTEPGSRQRKINNNSILFTSNTQRGRQLHPMAFSTSGEVQNIVSKKLFKEFKVLFF